MLYWLKKRLASKTAIILYILSAVSLGFHGLLLAIFSLFMGAQSEPMQASIATLPLGGDKFASGQSEGSDVTKINFPHTINAVKSPATIHEKADASNKLSVSSGARERVTPLGAVDQSYFSAQNTVSTGIAKKPVIPKRYSSLSNFDRAIMQQRALVAPTMGPSVRGVPVVAGLREPPEMKPLRGTTVLSLRASWSISAYKPEELIINPKRERFRSVQRQIQANGRLSASSAPTQRLSPISAGDPNFLSPQNIASAGVIRKPVFQNSTSIQGISNRAVIDRVASVGPLRRSEDQRPLVRLRSRNLSELGPIRPKAVLRLENSGTRIASKPAMPGIPMSFTTERDSAGLPSPNRETKHREAGTLGTEDQFLTSAKQEIAASDRAPRQDTGSRRMTMPRAAIVPMRSFQGERNMSMITGQGRKSEPLVAAGGRRTATRPIASRIKGITPDIQSSALVKSITPETNLETGSPPDRTTEPETVDYVSQVKTVIEKASQRHLAEDHCQQHTNKAFVAMVVEHDGSLGEIWTHQTSGNSAFDSAAKNSARKLFPLPPPEPGLTELERTIFLPIQFVTCRTASVNSPR